MQQRGLELGFKHTLREGNQCADFIAKLGPSSGVLFLDLYIPPSDMSRLLMVDVMGLPFLRV
ncbi:hypothetical protein HKD37_07G018193 [Glycine soja]